MNCLDGVFSEALKNSRRSLVKTEKAGMKKPGPPVRIDTFAIIRRIPANGL